MYVDLSGKWHISLEADEGRQEGHILLPGILQAAGYGNPITRHTPWVSSLHDPFWYEREEYRYAQEEGVRVPFLCQPPRHFLGQAVYRRKILIPGKQPEIWYFHAEAARWRSQVWIDGELRGEDCTLCGPHHIRLGLLEAGEHTLKVVMDNSMLYPYRPDAHGVSDALGGTWNGMAGEIALFTQEEEQKRRQERKQYAQSHPRTIETREGRFYLDGAPFYFRGTHFGGEYPLTGYPSTDKAWWTRIMKIIREWGLNSIRFHSYCPPEAAFAAADEEGICLLVECGMWNHFEKPEGKNKKQLQDNYREKNAGREEEDCGKGNKDGEEMTDLLRKETRRILEYFGHHPSFVFFSSGNEPGGAWYEPLREWVKETAAYDRELGYGGRRIYTAQSGWFYDVPPSQIEGTDFIYFHRSGYGPYPGGTIRNPRGWRGGDYSPSLKGVKKPVICHELGQICAYPDYAVMDKFTGYLQPGNFTVFRENARANGILPYLKDFVRCSGENQLRLYKEELEANFRTPQIQGFELLDLHDYLGQGTALVGILDAFWESKGYGKPQEFRSFCADTVLLARCSSYVWKNTDKAVIPAEVCHYGKEDIEDGVICWKLCQGEKELHSGRLFPGRIARGGNTKAGSIVLDFPEITQRHEIRENAELTLALNLEGGNFHNSWKLYVYARQEAAGGVLYTRDWEEAKAALEAGGNVIYSPWLSDLNYQCPALSGRSVNWNSQMGPAWCRTMGIVVEAAHPVFRHFPTERWGGWQWEDILANARGFHMEGLEQVKPVVQPVDDWNRNLLQGLIFEARVLKGNMLLVSASLEGSFEERPGACALKNALLAYGASGEFQPEAEVLPEAVEDKLFPMLRMKELTQSIAYENIGREGCAAENTGIELFIGEGLKVRNGAAIVEGDPGSSVRVEGRAFPVRITIEFGKAFFMEGILYVPEQRDREHAGFARDYGLEVRDADTGIWERTGEGTLRNTCRSQKLLFSEKIRGDAIRITFLSGYGCVDRYVWEEEGSGWHRVFKPGTALLQIAGIHVLCGEKGPHSDRYASGSNEKSRTKEIEL